MSFSSRECLGDCLELSCFGLMCLINDFGFAY